MEIPCLPRGYCTQATNGKAPSRLSPNVSFSTFEANLWLEEVLLIVSHHTLRLKGAFRLLESAPYPEQTDVVVLNTQEAGIKVDETRVPVCRSTTTSTAACDEILWNSTILVHEV
jgi:hypothetical protein